MSGSVLKPATELARTSRVAFPTRAPSIAAPAKFAGGRDRASPSYRARRRTAPCAAAGRRGHQYLFVRGEGGAVNLSDLFGDKQTLVIYSYMFGPQREKACPMCTSFMSTWEAKLPDHRAAHRVRFRCALADRAIDRGQEGARLDPPQIYSDISGDYTRDYVSAADADMPGYSVFTRRDGAIRHFWSGEMGPSIADPGQDPRGAPDLDPLWTILDTTPEGRGKDWYPS